MNENQTTKLYRTENPSHDPEHASPNGFTGRWFSPDINKALHFNYLGRAAKRGGVNLLVAQVPTEQMNDYLAANNAEVIESGVDFEPNEDYLLPRDGSVPFQIVSLDGLVEKLGKSPSNLMIYKETRDAIMRFLRDNEIIEQNHPIE